MADYSVALNETFRKEVKGKNKGAVSAVIFNNEKILYSFRDGFIDKKKKLVPQENSLFMIGSNTKVFTALGIFRLIEDGKLSLDDPITKYIPEFSIKSRIGEYPVIIGDLLMHRAGIQCDLLPFMISDKGSYEDIIAAMKDTYRIAEPGKMFAYSNVGYTLLGVVEERITGMKYYDFIKSCILDPLGIELYTMHEEDLPPEVSDRIARCYNKKGKKSIDMRSCMLPAGPHTYTTIGGLAKIGQLLLNDGECNGVRLYKPETIQTMKTLKTQEEVDNEAYCVGYGLMHHFLSPDYITGPTMGHGGDTTYQHAAFDFLPEKKIGVIVFTNFETGSGLSRELSRDLFNCYLKEAGYPEKPRKENYVAFDPRECVRKYDTLSGPIEFRINDKGELSTEVSKVKFTLKKDENGWLVAKPTSIIGKIPPFSASLKGLKFKQATYYGNEVLVIQQRNLTQIVGDLYREPGVNSAWLKALGTYHPEDKAVKEMADKIELVLKDGGVTAVLFHGGSKRPYCLDIISETEAITKGFGRDSKQTIILQDEGNRYVLKADGAVFIRAKKE